MEAKQLVSARVPKEMFSQLKARADESGVKLTDVVIAALGDYLGIERPETLADSVAQLKGDVRGLQGEVRDLLKKLTA